MGLLLVIKPDGTEVAVPAKKLSIPDLYPLIGNGCTCVTRVRVRYNGRMRDLWLDDNGWIKRNVANPKLRKLYAESHKVPLEEVQEFAGTGVIWDPSFKEPAESRDPAHNPKTGEIEL
jgi:hypothetical protein